MELHVPARARESKRQWLGDCAVALLGLGATLLLFAVRGSPLHQHSALMRFYDVLIGPPLALWLHDRWQQRAETPFWSLALDATVFLVALARALALVPAISGHATFLAYATVASSTRPGREVALFALGMTAAVKIQILNDYRTLVAGALLGAAAGWLHQVMQRRRSRNHSPAPHGQPGAGTTG